MAGADLFRAIEYVVQRLAADATLMAACPGGVHDSVAPPDTAYPFVTVSDAGNASVDGVGDIRVGITALLTVVVVDEGESFKALQAAVERIETLLHAFTTGTSALAYVTSKREEEVHRRYSEDGVQYCEMGGRYRMFVRSA